MSLFAYPIGHWAKKIPAVKQHSLSFKACMLQHVGFLFHRAVKVLCFHLPTIQHEDYAW